MSDSIDEIPGVTLTPTPNDAALTPNDVDLGLFLSGLTGDPAGPDLAQITVPALLGPPQPLPRRVKDRTVPSTTAKVVSQRVVVTWSGRPP